MNKKFEANVFFTNMFRNFHLVSCEQNASTKQLFDTNKTKKIIPVFLFTSQLKNPTEASKIENRKEYIAET